MQPSDSEADIQRRYFEEPDEQRFRWTTQALGFAETEDELLAPALQRIEGPCLELGCGEGNNLARLVSCASCVGVDLFVKKLSFAAREVPQARFVNAEASTLPFPDTAFATVFIRDLLHHVPDPGSTLREAIRVLRGGGLLYILEPNGRNPLVRLQTHLVRAEAQARRFDAPLISSWLAALPLEDIRLEMRQALPLRRMILHYRYGLPSLGRYALPRAVLRSLEKLADRLLPASRWSYVSLTARRIGGVPSRSAAESSP